MCNKAHHPSIYFLQIFKYAQDKQTQYDDKNLKSMTDWFKIAVFYRNQKRSWSYESSWDAQLTVERFEGWDQYC